MPLSCIVFLIRKNTDDLNEFQLPAKSAQANILPISTKGK